MFSKHNAVKSKNHVFLKKNLAENLSVGHKSMSIFQNFQKSFLKRVFFIYRTP